MVCDEATQTLAIQYEVRARRTATARLRDRPLRPRRQAGWRSPLWPCRPGGYNGGRRRPAAPGILMPDYAYATVDVFTERRRFGGNPRGSPMRAASTARPCRRFAAEMNYSETTFRPATGRSCPYRARPHLSPHRRDALRRPSQCRHRLAASPSASPPARCCASRNWLASSRPAAARRRDRDRCPCAVVAGRGLCRPPALLPVSPWRWIASPPAPIPVAASVGVDFVFCRAGAAPCPSSRLTRRLPASGRRGRGRPFDPRLRARGRPIRVRMPGAACRTWEDPATGSPMLPRRLVALARHRSCPVARHRPGCRDGPPERPRPAPGAPPTASAPASPANASRSSPAPSRFDWLKRRPAVSRRPFGHAAATHLVLPHRKPAVSPPARLLQPGFFRDFIEAEPPSGSPRGPADRRGETRTCGQRFAPGSRDLRLRLSARAHALRRETAELPP